MTRSSRRKPDKRRVADNITYSVPEIALLYDKAETTIGDWLTKGLPTIDNLEPTLVFGWQLKRWHQSWWASRKTNCGSTGFYCSPCRGLRSIKSGSLEIIPTNSRAFRVLAVCTDCNAKMFRMVKAENIAELYAQDRKPDEENGFINSGTQPNNALKSKHYESTPQLDDQNTASVGLVDKLATLNQPRNPVNERLKRNYYLHLKHACGLSDLSIEKRVIALLRFEAFIDWKGVESFSRQTALEYKAYLTTTPLQLQTRVAELRGLMHFLNWVIASRTTSLHFDALDVAYLRATIAERNACQTTRIVEFPSVLQSLEAFRSMPNRSDLDLEARAIFGLLASTGIRIGAVRTLRLKHVDIVRRLIHQDPTEVETKFRREIFSFILDVEEEFGQALFEWIRKLKQDLDFGSNDPLFPKTLLSNVPNCIFGERMLVRQPYDCTQRLAKIIKSAFQNVGMVPYPPHRFRNMLVHEMYARELSPSQVRAWSQNLGHMSPKTSLVSYGRLTIEEQEAIIRKGSKGDANRPLTRADIQMIIEKITGATDYGSKKPKYFKKQNPKKG